MLACPLGYRRWAERFMAEHLSGKFVVCVNLRQSALTPNPAVIYRDAPFAEWYAFFDQIARKYRDVTFLLDGALFAVAVHYWRGPKLWTTMRLSWQASLVSGLVAVGPYVVFIWVLSLGAMGPVAALREASVLFAPLIGTVVLRERLGLPRTAAARLITLGIVLIAHAQ